MWPLSNLKSFAKSRPPLVIFMLCLCAFGVVLLSLAYFIENNEVVDPDLSSDWNTFLTAFAQLRFCLTDSPIVSDVTLLSPKLDLKIGGLGSEMDIKPADSTDKDTTKLLAVHEVVPPSSKDVKTHSVMLELTIQPTQEFLTSGNYTHLAGQVRGHQMGFSGPAAGQLMNISLVLPPNLNHTRCSDNTTCNPITVKTCISMEGAENFFPNTQTPKVCEKPPVTPNHHMSYIRGFKDYTFTKYYMCHQKTKIMVQYESQPSLTVMLSLHDKSLIALHLMHTSCFLFVMVVTLLFYAVVRGRPASEFKYHAQSQSI